MGHQQAGAFEILAAATRGSASAPSGGQRTRGGLQRGVRRIQWLWQRGSVLFEEWLGLQPERVVLAAEIIEPEDSLGAAGLALLMPTVAEDPS